MFVDGPIYRPDMPGFAVCASMGHESWGIDSRDPSKAHGQIGQPLASGSEQENQLHCTGQAATLGRLETV